jgi:hypothetical protein
LAQSINPLYYLSDSDFPISAASLVLTKSKGYTQVNPVAPANPPAIKFPKKNLNFSVLGSTPFTNLDYNISLIEKLMAVVGKYLITLAIFPLQKA